MRFAISEYYQLILYHFQVITVCWSNYHSWQGSHVFNSLIWGELLNSELQKLALETWEHRWEHLSIVWCTTCFDQLNC